MVQVGKDHHLIQSIETALADGTRARWVKRHAKQAAAEPFVDEERVQLLVHATARGATSHQPIVRSLVDTRFLGVWPGR